jgi:hypothetical protein
MDIEDMVEENPNSTRYWRIKPEYREELLIHCAMLGELRRIRNGRGHEVWIHLEGYGEELLFDHDWYNVDGNNSKTILPEDKEYWNFDLQLYKKLTGE